MRTATSLLFLLLLLIPFPLLATPADSGLIVKEARDHISAKRYGDAVQSLKQALLGVDQLSPADRDQAAAAIHFYSAVAYSGLMEDAEATTHLQAFFALVPNAKLSAPEKYEPHFVQLFRKAQPAQAQPAQAQQTPDEHAEFRFDNFYPGFQSTARATSAELSVSHWPVALAILASKTEKRAWEATGSSTEQARFIEGFWKRRDPQPDTPANEFRDTFEQRVTFADRAFESPDARGATSDRGRVFVLLGVPSSVRRRPLTPLDPIQILDESQVNGSIEQWVYGNTQLPNRIAKQFVGYRFVSQRGIGDNVLQREEPYAQQALILAMNPNELARK